LGSDLGLSAFRPSRTGKIPPPLSLPDLAAMVLAGCNGNSNTGSSGGPVATGDPAAAVGGGGGGGAGGVSAEAARKASEKLLLDLALALPGEVVGALGGWLQNYIMPEGTFSK
jgi:hypothetical protein